MKTIAAAEARQGFKDVLEQAQSEDVVIMSHGKPVAVVVGVKGRTVEDLFTHSAEFWQMILARRAEPTQPLKDALQELERTWSQAETAKRAKTSRRVPKRASSAARVKRKRS